MKESLNKQNFHHEMENFFEPPLINRIQQLKN